MKKRTLALRITLLVTLTSLVAAWIISYAFRCDLIYARHTGDGWAIDTGMNRGRIEISFATGIGTEFFRDGWDFFHRPTAYSPNELMADRRILGFGFFHHSNGDSRLLIVGVPFWFLIVVFALLTWLYFRSHRRRSKASFPVEPTSTSNPPPSPTPPGPTGPTTER